jgi:hypothetical protein
VVRPSTRASLRQAQEALDQDEGKLLVRKEIPSS